MLLFKIDSEMNTMCHRTDALFPTSISRLRHSQEAQKRNGNAQSLSSRRASFCEQMGVTSLVYIVAQMTAGTCGRCCNSFTAPCLAYTYKWSPPY